MLTRGLSKFGNEKRRKSSKMVTEEQKKQAQFWLGYSQRLSGTIRYTEALAAVERSLAMDDNNVWAGD